MRQLAKTIVRLNVETRSFHSAVDAAWLALARSTSLTRLDYLHHLVRVYGFDAPLEAALAYTPHLDGFFDLQRSSRAGLLAQDLLALGVKPAEIASLRQCLIAPFASVAEACGWLYVHQRSILLHDAVHAALVSRLPEVANATAYLRAHDGRVGAVWDDVGQALERVARTSLIENRIVSAANDAFRAAREWFGYSGNSLGAPTTSQAANE